MTIKNINNIGLVVVKEYSLFDNKVYLGHTINNPDLILIDGHGLMRNKNQIINYISVIKPQTWRSDTKKKEALIFYNKVLSDMISYERDTKIDYILGKNQFDPTLAC